MSQHDPHVRIRHMHDHATREAYPAIPWREAATTRNLLIHGYDIVRVDILCDTIRSDFPALIEQLDAILRSRE